MGTFKVDSDVVNQSVDTLKKLLAQCEELYNEEIPDSTVDKGKTHNELYDLCQNLKTTCQYLGELINNSILFLGQSSEMFDTSDRQSAAAIAGSTTETGSSGTLHGGGGRRIDDNVSEFSKQVSALSRKEGFMEGQYGPNGYNWMEGVGSYTTTNGNTVSIGGASCFAMAHMMQAEVIGDRGDRIYTNDISSIMIGDVIHYYGDGADSTYGHWVFVTDIQDNKITVSEGNWEAGTVTHGRQIDLNNISLTEIDRVNNFVYK